MSDEIYIPTSKDYVVTHKAMTCGSAEAEDRKYHNYVGKSGRIWLVANQANAADNIYVEGGPNSDGFGGRTLTFKLVSGGEIKLKGPWHTNAHSLLEDTDIDIRDKTFTFVVVSRQKRFIQSQTVMIDVLYRDKDDKARLGVFHRGDIIARDIAKKLGYGVYLYSQSSTGSTQCLVKPNEIFSWEKSNGA